MSRKRKRRDAEDQAAWLFRRHKNLNMLAQPGRHSFVVVLDQLKSDFNIGKIFRSADAFGAREVHLIGIDAFDPAPAKGAFKAVPARFHVTFRHCYDELLRRGYTLFALAPGGERCEPLANVDLPAASAFIVGHEVRGLQLSSQQFPALRPLSIAQYGRVESLNVSVAASVIMYEYVRQRGKYGEN